MKPRVYPSELRSYHYCPRLLFFELHMGRRRGLLEKLNLLLRTFYHMLLEALARSRGFKTEEPMELDMGSYVLRGRPDEYLVREGEVLVVEIKTTRAPKEGAWLGDYLQGAAYAMMLMQREGVGEAWVEVRYLDRSARVKVKGEHLQLVKFAAEEVLAVREGVVPFANRSERRCARCPFKEECLELGDLPEEMGEWVTRDRSIF
ncbi:MAG: CRISPR-associated protein Cas4 [Acidilobaceae archaeon]